VTSGSRCTTVAMQGLRGLGETWTRCKSARGVRVRERRGRWLPGTMLRDGWSLVRCRCTLGLVVMLDLLRKKFEEGVREMCMVKRMRGVPKVGGVTLCYHRNR
jgi:hypothetical protein